VFAVAAALLIAAGVMLYLKWSSDPAPGEGGGTGNVVGTSGALIVLLLLAGASARRRNKGKGGDRNG
jgi:hypothetical protein